MIEIKMTFQSVEDAADFMLRASGAGVEMTTSPAAVTVAGEPGRRTRKKAEPEAVKTETVAEPEKAAISSGEERVNPDDKPELSAEEAAAKFVEVRAAMAKLMQKVGSDNARQFLADFQKVALDKSKLSETPPARYDELIQAAEKKLAE